MTPTGGRQVAADRELDRRSVGQHARLLHRALAVGARPDDHRAVAVLQRRGDHLGGARGAPVDEHDDRRGRVAVADGVERAVGRVALLVGHHGPAVEEGRRHLDGLVEQAAGVAPQVEDDAAGVRRADRQRWRPRTLPARPHG